MLKLMVMLANNEAHGRSILMNGHILFLKSTSINSIIEILPGEVLYIGEEIIQFGIGDILIKTEVMNKEMTLVKCLKDY